MTKSHRVSDEEYVERVRKTDRTVRRTWWMWPILLVGMFYCLARGGELVQQYTSHCPVSKQHAYLALALGGATASSFVPSQHRPPLSSGSGQRLGGASAQNALC